MDLTQFTGSLANVVAYLKEDLKSIRTGRANPVILEQLPVETYGGQTVLKLMELASIVSEGPSALVVSPFDPSTTQDIERAILKSPLGFSPQTQGNRIVIRIPPLSEEQREKYIKVVHQKIEERKNMLRNHRDDIRKKIKQLFTDKELTEDHKYRLEKEIDSIVLRFTEEIEKINAIKEKEIREV